MNTEYRMPKPLFNNLGKRQPRALVVGLRRIVKDPEATVAQRLEACKLLAIVGGYIPHDPSPRNRSKGEMAAEAVSIPNRAPSSAASVNRLKELAGRMVNENAVRDRPPILQPEDRGDDSSGDTVSH